MTRRRCPLWFERLDDRDLPSIALPIEADFESNAIPQEWSFSQYSQIAANVNGPTQGNYVGMIETPPIAPSLGLSTIRFEVNLTNASEVFIEYDLRIFSLFPTSMTVAYQNDTLCSGVGFSVDGGNMWWRIESFGSTPTSDFQFYRRSISDIASKEGITLTENTLIEFRALGSGGKGVAIDNVRVFNGGEVSGQVYHDADKSGTITTGDSGVANDRVFIDSDNSGDFTQGREVVYFSQQLPAPIFDTKTSRYPLDVNVLDGHTISDLNVTMALTHNFTADLDITLISPSGTRVLLTSDNGGSGDNYLPTTFDDEAATAITAGSAPFNGAFRPEGKLSDFDGEDFDGVWYLEISDDAAGVSGSLLSWSLTMGERFQTTFNKTLGDVSNTEYVFNADPLPGVIDVDVDVNITHSNVQDLILSLNNGFGATSILSKFNGGSGNNYTNTTFDDQASMVITLGSAPFTGRFLPEEPIGNVLASGMGTSALRLRIQDTTAGTVGVLNSGGVTYYHKYNADISPHTITANKTHLEIPVAHVPGEVVDVNAMVNLEHTSMSSVEAYLTDDFGLNGRLLFNNSGGAAATNGIITFDSEAIPSIAIAAAPVAGTFRPAASLTAFNEREPNRSWYVTLENNGPGSGTAHWAALVVRHSDARKSTTLVSLPDQSTKTATLNVSGFSGRVTDLNVNLHLLHTWAADVDMFLTAPNGKTIELFSDVGGNSDNFSGTTLDDEALTSITIGSGPFTGRYQPENPLSAFDGLNPNGLWKLTMVDDAAANAGTLLSWGLTITDGERFATTLSDGTYSFSDLPSGAATVRLQPRAGRQFINPVFGSIGTTVSAVSPAINKNFAVFEDTTPPVGVFVPVTPGLRKVPVPDAKIGFGEVVTGVSLGDFTLTRNGTPIALAGVSLNSPDGMNYTLSNLSNLNLLDGTYNLKLIGNGSGIADAFNNPLSSSAVFQVSWVIDTVVPQIVEITAASTVTDVNVGPNGWWVRTVFSEPMDPTQAPNVLFPAEFPAGTLSFQTGQWALNNTVYKANYSVADLGTTLLNVDVRVQGGADLAGNEPLGVTLPDAVDIDTQNTVLSASTTAASGTYGPGATIPITLHLSELSHLTGTLAVTLSTGKTLYVNGPLTSLSQTINYIVTPGENTNLLQIISVSLVDSSTLTDMAGNPADLSALVSNIAPAKTIAIQTATVNNVVVNGGDPQRSRVTRLTIEFNAPVNAASLTSAGAIKLIRTSSGAYGTLIQTGAAGATGRITINPASGLVNSLTLTFDNANGAFVTDAVEYGSLTDGRWQLSIPSLNYVSPLDGFSIRRLFGDINNDGTVDAIDFAQFGNTIGITSGGGSFNSAFDFNTDGTIDATDFSQFGNRFGTTN